ncbi:MAG: DUF2807 domain-containing protein [Flavobacteriaceae bacterium]|mgnify:CR=1 FL=1|jgi:hypothetical protein|nr:DUF2807 domain-containing protein [Bacteroidota bacterium]MDC0956413.1 DUF2807 domain-containing protein [Flavobacteriaceae bacterium]MDG1380379.1 DUF2807 domain-containing protein [Flavobacteriaceae bacterium]|tara:strand:- start:730 stop:1407 length:678 start_codon:yes stop_codon:yes gene_type:complete
MKFLLLIYYSLYTSTLLLAQDSVVKNIGDFSILKAYDLINVELIKSDKNIAEISGDNKNNIEIVNKNGVLKIRLNIEKSFDGKATNVKLFYNTLDVIDANEGAVITSYDTIRQYEIELKAQEGGLIKTAIDTKEIIMKAVTGGVIDVSGITQHQNIAISTGGVVKAATLKSKNTDILITTGGEAFVNSTESLDIKIRAGGDVFIYGKPKKVTKNKVLGGRIKYMD